MATQVPNIEEATTDLLVHYELNNIVCSDSLFKALIDHMKSYELLAPHLDIGEGQVFAIQKETHSDYTLGKLKLLQLWRRTKGDKATYFSLTQAFLAADNRHCAEFVVNHAKCLSPSQLPNQGSVFPEKSVPKWNEMSKGEKEKFKEKLVVDTEKVKGKYATCLTNIARSFQDRRVSIERVQILLLSKLPAAKPNATSGSEMLSNKIEAATSLSKLFVILARHTSWFNYQLLEFLIEKLANEVERVLWSSYKNEILKPYLIRSLFQVPSQSFSTPAMSDAPAVPLSLKLVDDIDLSVKEVLVIKDKLSELLEVPVLELSSYDVGSHIVLTFAIPEDIFNLYPAHSTLHQYISYDDDRGSHYISANITTILLPTHAVEAGIINKILHYLRQAKKERIANEKDDELQKITEVESDIKSHEIRKYKREIKKRGLEDIMELKERENDIVEQGDDVIEEIHECVESIKRHLVDEVSRVVQLKQQSLVLNKQKAEAVQECTTQIQEQDKRARGQDVSLEEANITFTKAKHSIDEMCENIGTVQYSFLPANIEGEISFQAPLIEQGKEITATLLLQTKLGCPDKMSVALPFNAYLVSPNGSKFRVSDVKEDSEKGKYAMHFTPSLHGAHQLKIQAKFNDVEIHGSPFSFHVMPSLEMIGKSVMVIPDLTHPWGIAVNDKKGLLMVARRDAHCVTMFNEKGKKIRSLESETGNVQLSYPRGVAFDGNASIILVASNHCLQKFTLEGECLMSVGSDSEGDEPLQFRHPKGLVVNSFGQVYVADDKNHRVQVINIDDFTYSHCIGEGKLNRPFDVALDHKGNVFVASYNENCIKVFKPGGEFLKEITQGGLLYHPSSIAMGSDNLMYITEHDDDRISVFTTNGEFVKVLPCEKELSGPEGIAIDGFGNLYISNTNKNEIIVL